jgi:hypothetical protein
LGNARCQQLPLAWFFPDTEAVTGFVRPGSSRPSGRNAEGHRIPTGLRSTGPHWGRTPPEDHGQQRIAAVSRAPRSVAISERSPRYFKHPDCLSTEEVRATGMRMGADGCGKWRPSGVDVEWRHEAY